MRAKGSKAAALLVLLLPVAECYCVPCGTRVAHGPPRSPHQRAARLPAVQMEATAAVQLAESSSRTSSNGGGSNSDGDGKEDWSAWLTRPRYARLRDIALSISVRRTVDEAELALKLANEYQSNPSLLQDIDFASLILRLQTDMGESMEPLKASGLLSAEELASIAERQQAAVALLEDARPPEVADSPSGAAASAVPKLRRVISRARELPLTIEMPAIQMEDGLDFRLALNESKNVAEAVRQTWQRLNGASPEKEETLFKLQRESKALLSLRQEATKLRGGIKLVQRQKELKSAYLIRFGTSAGLLEETLRADVAIAKLQKELSLKSALLEMERISLTLESELSLTSSLVDQLLRAVEGYGELESSLHAMVADVQAESHERVDEMELQRLERQIGFLLLQLGLTAQDAGTPESFSWERTREAIEVNTKRAGEGLAFYSRGVKLMGEDVQLMVNMLSRAVVQGYTLRPREVKLLRRIGKDMFTLIPFVVILLIPLSPLGHVLVFSFIQRFFPDFYPSQFTESRQNIMSMYSSITSSPAIGAIEANAVASGTAVASGDLAEAAVVDRDAVDATVETVEDRLQSPPSSATD